MGDTPVEEASEAEAKHYFLNGHEVSAEAVGAVPASADGAAAAARGAAQASVAQGFGQEGSALETVLGSLLASGGSRCLRLFVAGASTHVGKTTVCLGILAALRRAGVSASELAYIKPATQCEAPDLLQRWCEVEGIEYVAGENAPLVFYSGFTRSFLAGEQGTSAQWLQKIAARVDKMTAGRRILLVDGVGFPAVGSIVGADNADIALAVRAPVLLVGKSGVGSAVDSFSLNSCYFTAKGVPVLGALFNLAEVDGFYSADKCLESIQAWFDHAGRRESCFGVVPIAPSLQGLREKISEQSAEQLRELADVNAAHFAQHVDIAGIVAAAAADPWCRGRWAAASLAPAGRAVPPAAPPARHAALPATFEPVYREKVAAAAAARGSKGGG